MSETLMTETVENTQETDAASQPTAPVEGQGQEQQGSEAATESKPADKPEGAPEQYEFVAPEGHKFDDEVLAKYSEVAKELDLSQEKAQKMLDTLAPVVNARQMAQVEEFYSDIGGMPDKWADAAKADKEFGGDKLPENMAFVKKAMDTFGTPELRNLLNKTGIGNHPELVRAFYRAGKAISEDSFVGGGASTGNAKDARNLYSASNMNP